MFFAFRVRRHAACLLPSRYRLNFARAVDDQTIDPTRSSKGESESQLCVCTSMLGWKSEFHQDGRTTHMSGYHFTSQGRGGDELQLLFEQQRGLDTTECVQTAKHLLMCRIVADAEPMRSRETRKQTGVNYTYSRSLHPSSSSL